MQAQSRTKLPGLALAVAVAAVLPTGVAMQEGLAAQQGVATQEAAVAGEDSARAAERRGPTDPAELEAFLDGLMMAHMTEKHIAGATVAVVRDGAVLLAKGYGFADVAERRRVDAERTLFRIGSVTKLFTWTAVMQLVEAGQLDLDADVATYLDFEIPATFDQPITMRHILTHTPGFEEDSRDLFTEDPEAMQPLGEWLATHLPGRVRAPGTFSSYSNYATALAGYVVERVSGQPYDEYIEEHILEPLGMERTTTRQPLPPRLAPFMSEGYVWQNGRFVPQPFEIVMGAAPAGSMSATATDMATFMLAHLNQGQLDGARILSEATAELMHRRAFAHDERVSGFGLGFYEKSRPDLRIIGHGGDTGLFHSDLALVPSENLGVFVSYNTASGGELSFGPFLDAFMDHYYPVPLPTPVADEDARITAERVAGEYAFNRRSYTTFQKAIGLALTRSVAAQPDGSIVLNWDLGATRFVPVGDLLYREALGENLLSFREDADGDITHAFMGLAPMMVLERVPWHESATLHQLLLGLAILVFLGTVLAAVRRWWRRRKGISLPGDDLYGRRILVALSATNLAFVVVLVLLLSDSSAVLTGPATGLRVALVLPLIGLALALVAAYMAFRQWKRDSGTLGARLRYGTVVVLALAFAWSLNVWNLLGWRM